MPRWDPLEDETQTATTGLAHYDAMRRELVLCATTDEVKDIKDRAHAAEVYAKQIHDTEAEKQLAAIRIRAERRLGEILKEQAEKGERETRGGDKKSKSPEGTLKPQTLADIGISKNESSRCQQLAAIPEPEFEKAISEPDVIPTTKGVLRATGEVMPKEAKRAKTPKARPNVVIEGQHSEDAEQVARKIIDNASAMTGLIVESMPGRGAALKSSYGPILYADLMWLARNVETFLASAKKPSMKAIREAKTAHPEYAGDEVA